MRFSINDLINEDKEEKVIRLKNARVEFVVASERSLESLSQIDVSNASSQQVEKLVFPLLDGFGVFGKYYNKVYDVEFEYSRKAGSRSISHQRKISGEDFSTNALVQANLKDVCKTAYPVEAHEDEKPKSNVHDSQKLKKL